MGHSGDFVSDNSLPAGTEADKNSPLHDRHSNLQFYSHSIRTRINTATQNIDDTPGPWPFQQQIVTQKFDSSRELLAYTSSSPATASGEDFDLSPTDLSLPILSSPHLRVVQFPDLGLEGLLQHSTWLLDVLNLQPDIERLPDPGEEELLQQIRNQQTKREKIDMMRLRQNFKCEHEKLLRLSKGKNASALYQNFFRRFPNYKKTWDNGINTFHHLLDGHPPSTLGETLYAILVAISLAATLDSKGKKFGMRDEVITDLDRWKMTILDPSEQELFDEISSLLWGKSPNSNQPRVSEGACATGVDGRSPSDLLRELIKRFRRLYRTLIPLQTTGDPAYKVHSCAGCHPLPKPTPTPIAIRPVDATVGPIDNGGRCIDTRTGLSTSRRHNSPTSPLQIPPDRRGPPDVIAADVPTPVPKRGTRTEDHLLLAAFIMAGSIFWAVFLFLNRMYTISFTSNSRRLLTNWLVWKTPVSNSVNSYNRRAEKGDRGEPQAVTNKMFKKSADIAVRELIKPLKEDPSFGLFDEILKEAETAIKQKTLTGFSSVAEFLQIQAEVSL